jgi:hypothetical protein
MIRGSPTTHRRGHVTNVQLTFQSLIQKGGRSSGSSALVTIEQSLPVTPNRQPVPAESGLIQIPVCARGIVAPEPMANSR